MKWRIYRLPGSREQWLIDHGPGSMVLACEKWLGDESVRFESFNGNPAATPRAWIAVSESELYLSEESGPDGRGGTWRARVARFAGPKVTK